jgi:hypothetical protein
MNGPLRLLDHEPHRHRLHRLLHPAHRYGAWREVPIALYAVSAVFAFYYLMPALGIGQ